ncbi:Acyl-CoA synthetase short-chain family member 3, mitochondrial [Neonectria ditissima]|uniref:Acyl-CoA synthetase short-chain family member 3, mitochondrial n=1 Tax=Neonectria ditissima TaxID=78410 RepID=A0A0N8H4U0_9HYPO|nr:Acyl-CoA synthetase short-chain family member 3, mitochondrial [Neonectria ditissima]
MSDIDDHVQDEVLRHSLEDPDDFWRHQAEHLHWHKKFTSTIQLTQKTLKNGITHDSWEWFPDGEISTCYNCVDRHVLDGHGDSVAIYFDSPVTNTKEKYTYRELLEEVQVLAGALREEGVKKGDVVMLYMPMIPSAVIGILAINRLGAIHSIVFGGFAPNALAQRIDSCKPIALLTASCGIDGNKPAIPYRPLVEEAITLATYKPSKTIVWQRDQLRWNPMDRNAGQSTWQKLVRSARARNIRADCVPVKSTDPVYIIHTSGTTGAPKGVLRDAGGHAVGLHLSISYLFNIHGPGCVAFTASDIGWIVGHSYIVYGPLLTGAATVLYEGKPVGTPDASAFWRIVDEYKVNTMFTAPTALRAIRRDDPENNLFTQYGKRGGLKTLKAIFLAGERSEPTLIQMYQDLLTQYGAVNSHVIDNWWSTEVGSPITGRALVPHAGKHRKTDVRGHPPPHLKAGSAGKAMPGFDVRIVDDAGNEVERGSTGNIVLAMPLAPTGFRTLWQDEERFWKGYLKRFQGKWLDTGDSGWIDQQGYIHVMSRNDDVLNVSAHRLSSGSLEQAIATHPLIAECCVVGIPDSIKGQMPFAFITLSTPDHPPSAVPDQQVTAEIQNLVRTQVGPIATLGGIIQGKGLIPKTRSGKILRRVLREMVENAVHGELAKEVSVPSTVEDASVVEVARAKIREYFELRGAKHGAVEGMIKARL